MFTPTFERRWLVTQDSFMNIPAAQVARHVLIRQTYLMLPSGDMMRVRVETSAHGQETACAAIKSGFGLQRGMKEIPMELGVANSLLELAAPVVLKKERAHIPLKSGVSMCIDSFLNPELAGLKLVELKMVSPDLFIGAPPYFEGVEVTNSLTNEHVFELLRELTDTPGFASPLELLLPEMPRIVITGAAGSGKSKVREDIEREFGGRVHCVPEVATIVIGTVQVPPPVSDPLKLAEFQRTIYEVQRRFERVSRDHAALRGKKAVITDRGTMDGAAYLPGGIAELERLCRTNAAAEYARYAKVICLEPPPREVYEKIMGDNPARSETYEETVALSKRTELAWSGHPNLVVIPCTRTWEEKRDRIFAEIRPYLD